jgi:hypothetical protein
VNRLPALAFRASGAEDTSRIEAIRQISPRKRATVWWFIWARHLVEVAQGCHRSAMRPYDRLLVSYLPSGSQLVEIAREPSARGFGTVTPFTEKSRCSVSEFSFYEGREERVSY